MRGRHGVKSSLGRRLPCAGPNEWHPRHIGCRLDCQRLRWGPIWRRRLQQPCSGLLGVWAVFLGALGPLSPFCAIAHLTGFKPLDLVDGLGLRLPGFLEHLGGADRILGGLRQALFKDAVLDNPTEHEFLGGFRAVLELLISVGERLHLVAQGSAGRLQGLNLSQTLGEALLDNGKPLAAALPYQPSPRIESRRHLRHAAAARAAHRGRPPRLHLPQRCRGRCRLRLAAQGCRRTHELVSTCFQCWRPFGGLAAMRIRASSCSPANHLVGGLAPSSIIPRPHARDGLLARHTHDVIERCALNIQRQPNVGLPRPKVVANNARGALTPSAHALWRPIGGFGLLKRSINAPVPNVGKPRLFAWPTFVAGLRGSREARCRRFPRGAPSNFKWRGVAVGMDLGSPSKGRGKKHL
mmetsp:Transcript_64462/g.186841  ORF Transcript_64462/g.186841 Transcript_64462/m.186841 type:complete len:410 (+) Transcript_64462:205-1434(+)